MPRKVFISILGAGFYESCKYIKEEFISSETRFIQEATLAFHGARQWAPTDAAIFLLTTKAEVVNWKKEIRERNNYKNELKPYKGLEQVLVEMQLPFSPTPLSIPDGKDEKEMWEIFEILLHALCEGDELYFDLTHSFRYLPMLTLVLGNYAKFLKGIKVKAISYGNYEAREVEKNEAPIVDLLPLSTLQDFTFASADYLENGNVDRLAKLCVETQPILEIPENKGNRNPFIEFANALQQVVGERQTCRGVEILKGESIGKLKKAIRNLPDTSVKPLKPVFEKIERSLEVFDAQENVMNGIEAAFWCLSNGLYQQATTIFHENIINVICENEGMNWVNQNIRMCIRTALSIQGNNIPEPDWMIPGKAAVRVKNRERIEALLENKLVQRISLPYLKMNDLRNDFNHSGIRRLPKKAIVIKTELKKLMEEITEIIKQEL